MSYEGMSAAIYVRSSTDDKGQRPDMQIEDCQRFCEREGIEVLKIFKDEGFSGGTLDRPGMQLMIGYIMTQQVSLIIAQDPSRISRSTDDMEELLRILRPRGTVLRYTTMHVRPEDTTEKAIHYISTSQGEQWREMHSLKVRKGMYHAQKHGTKTGNPVGRPTVEVNLDLVAECAAKGMSLRQTAIALGYSYSNLHRKCRGLGFFSDNQKHP